VAETGNVTGIGTLQEPAPALTLALTILLLETTYVSCGKHWLRIELVPNISGRIEKDLLLKHTVDMGNADLVVNLGDDRPGCAIDMSAIVIHLSATEDWKGSP
jgi:hypothetical protein